MNIKMINKIKSQGHPCRGCPYVFTRGGTDCIMDAVPGDCAWYFYKRLMGHTDATIPWVNCGKWGIKCYYIECNSNVKKKNSKRNFISIIFNVI